MKSWFSVTSHSLNAYNLNSSSGTVQNSSSLHLGIALGAVSHFQCWVSIIVITIQKQIAFTCSSSEITCIAECIKKCCGVPKTYFLRHSFFQPRANIYFWWQKSEKKIFDSGWKSQLAKHFETSAICNCKIIRYCHSTGWIKTHQ